APPKAPVSAPTKRGGGGPLRILWWQAPTLLNPHFATGTKDQDASRIFYEPLCSYDPDGNPFTADDVLFNWEFASDPATAAVTSGSYTGVERAEKIDTHTVKLVFPKPQPF